MKTQVVVDEATKRVICTAYSKGKQHDFQVWKKAKTAIHPNKRVVTDSAYQGMQKRHKKCSLPRKKSKHHPLTKEERKKNQAIARERIANENVLAAIKRFKMIADRYRNRRKRFALRFNLIAGIYNWELNM